MAHSRGSNTSNQMDDKDDGGSEESDRAKSAVSDELMAVSAAAQLADPVGPSFKGSARPAKPAALERTAADGALAAAATGGPQAARWRGTWPV